MSVSLWAWSIEIDVDGIMYELDSEDKTATVTCKSDPGNPDKCKDYVGDIVIPDVVTYKSLTYRVVSIGPEAFTCCNEITSITIPESITSISIHAFWGTSKLLEFIVASNNVVFSTQDGVLFNKDKTKLLYYPQGKSATHYTVPNSVRVIGENDGSEWAFANCKNLQSVTISDNVTKISNTAFRNCSGLTYVTIPNSVTEIGYNAFEGCTSLAVMKIGSGASFVPEGVDNLLEIIVSSDNPYVCSVDGVLFNKAKTELLKYPSGKTGATYIVPDGVKIIGEKAFEANKSLTSIQLPNGLEQINYGAFMECINLSLISIPHTVTIIDSDVFADTNIYNTESNWKDGILSIDNCIIAARKDIVSECYKINEGTRLVAAGAFNGCRFTNVIIPENVSNIGGAFVNCYKLEEFIVLSGNDFYSSEDGVLFTKDKKALLQYPMGKKNEVYAIPDGITVIEGGAFSGCSALTSISIPNSVTCIGESAFYNCSNIEKVNYLGTVDEWAKIRHGRSWPITGFSRDLYIKGELLTDVCLGADSVKAAAFHNCKSIKSVVVGEKVSFIGAGAFGGCEELKTVYNLSDLAIEKGSEEYGKVAYHAEKVLTGTMYNDLIVDDKDLILAYIGDTNITALEIPSFVKGIADGVFAQCDNIKKVICYSTLVPVAYQNSFAHYVAYLYVPCESFEDYDLDKIFYQFKATKCIEEIVDKLEIEVDKNNNVHVSWPATDGANSYKLVISKEKEVFCTLIFNAAGHLTSLDFENRSVREGFKFTVTGLDESTKYDYYMAVLDGEEKEFGRYVGEFSTNDYSPETDMPSATIEILADANISVMGGLMSVSDAEFVIYNAVGQDVSRFNGNLLPGVYMVLVEGDVFKVLVK